VAPVKLAGVIALLAPGQGAQTPGMLAPWLVDDDARAAVARWSDATVITTVSSPRKAQLAAAAGADHVIDYTSQDVAAEVRRIAPHGVAAIVEVAAAKNAAIDAKVLAPNGSVAVYADDDGAELSLPVRPLMQLNARWQFVLLYTVTPTAKAIAVEDVAAAVQDGAVNVGEPAGLPVQHFPLERTADAHAAVRSGGVGKVLIDVDGR